MKKLISVVLAAIMAAFTLAGCAGIETSKKDELIGTWKADSMEIDGARFTVDELMEIAPDDDDIDSRIVFKEGGKAWMANVFNYGEIVDWERTETGVIMLDDYECTLTDGLLSFEHDGNRVYFKKVSDSQIIGGESETTAAKTETKTDAVKPETLLGTWEVDSVEIDGAVFTLSEIEKMGEDTDGAENWKIVLKDGGKALLIDENEDGTVADWSLTGPVLTIGIREFTVDGDKMYLEGNGNKMYFKKVSDSQTLEVPSTGKTTSGSKNTDTGKSAAADSSVTIKQSADKYTWYIRNYVGRNCASIGSYTWGNARIDEYGHGEIELIFISEDGAFVDPDDTEVMKKYIVTGQSIAPNTELKLTFEKKDNGEEYDTLVESQNIYEIELYVKPIEN